MIFEANDQNGIDTVYIKDEISRCEDIEEVKEKILPMLKTQQENWSRKINEIIRESGCTKVLFSEKCGVSRVTVDKWCKGSVPRNREQFIQIGLVAGYNIDQMNQLLQRYGRYPALYSKSLEDCICIYVLSREAGDESWKLYNDILGRIKGIIVKKDSEETRNITTLRFDEKLSEVKSEDELGQFINDNITLFSMSFNKLYSYILATISANYSKNIHELAESQGWSSSLRQCVSSIRNKSWYPTRNKIISIGLHLSMDHEQIDEMLMMAHMEPLCAKNIFESIIMFILDDADLNDLMNESSEDYNPDSLCIYAKSVMEKMNLPEIEDFISEISEIDNAW